MTDSFSNIDLNRLMQDSQMDQEQEGVKRLASLSATFYRSCLREKDCFGRGQAMTLTATFVSSYITASIQNGKG